jgi:hypothetical protein
MCIRAVVKAMPIGSEPSERSSIHEERGEESRERDCNGAAGASATKNQDEKRRPKEVELFLLRE